MLLARAEHEAWLNGSAADSKAVVEQYPQEVMVAYWSARASIDSPKNNDAVLIQPRNAPFIASPRAEP